MELMGSIGFFVTSSLDVLRGRWTLEEEELRVPPEGPAMQTDPLPPSSALRLSGALQGRAQPPRGASRKFSVANNNLLFQKTESENVIN